MGIVNVSMHGKNGLTMAGPDPFIWKNLINEKRRPELLFRRLFALCRLIHPAGGDLLGKLGQHVLSHAAHELD